MNLDNHFLMRYLMVSVLSYGLVLQIVGILSETISSTALAITLSFLAVYGFDFTLTSLFVFQAKIKIISIIRFLAVTFFFFAAVLIVSKIFLIFFDSVFIATVFTGISLAPLRFLVSKNYIFNSVNSFQKAIKDSIGQISRGTTQILRGFDKQNRFEKASKYRVLNYAKSLLGFQNSTLLMNLDLPWWPFSATKHIENRISNQEFNVFEWGSGASTIWLSRRVKSVVSVEHDVDWSATMISELDSRELTNVSLCSIPPQFSQLPKVSSGKSGFANLDFSDYVESISDFGKFDLIVIDGRARVNCWEQACKHLEAGGLIVLDNYNRSRYQIDTEGFRVEFFSGLTPASVWPTYTLVAEKL